MCDRLMTMQEAADCRCQVVVKEWNYGKPRVYAYPLSDLFPKSLFQREKFWFRWDVIPHRIDITDRLNPKDVREHWVNAAVLPIKVWKLLKQLDLFTEQED